MVTPLEIIGAQGKFAALIASVLQSARVIQMQELGDLLGIFAVTVSETDPVEGDILAVWAATIRDAAGLHQRERD